MQTCKRRLVILHSHARKILVQSVRQYSALVGLKNAEGKDSRNHCFWKITSTNRLPRKARSGQICLCPKLYWNSLCYNKKYPSQATLVYVLTHESILGTQYGDEWRSQAPELHTYIVAEGTSTMSNLCFNIYGCKKKHVGEDIKYCSRYKSIWYCWIACGCVHFIFYLSSTVWQMTPYAILTMPFK